MIALIQRVSSASVSVDDPPYHEEIAAGLCVLLGVVDGDDQAVADWIAGKIARLRIFRDQQNRMNRSVNDVRGAVLLISQFTLAGDCSRGNRPSFISAAAPEVGERLYRRVAQQLAEEHGLEVRTGVFGAMMEVRIVNDGPVTLIVQR